jgi:hypothetical protein
VVAGAAVVVVVAGAAVVVVVAGAAVVVVGVVDSTVRTNVEGPAELLAVTV